ncbi:hypothetical protein RND81_07G065300 [Saponaria officinalis]|uniref:Reverse transcriptase zinc-binding domain-containing protein n=1 Tax=Saponaria officinalis TaxID=3572 RepID=A0AAW1JNX4_SAPOF
MAEKRALDCFASWSGLYANLEKSETYFGGVQPAVRQLIISDSGFTAGTFPFRYLGIPMNTSRLSINDYASLITKFQSYIHHWSSKLLSYAGRIQLINTVLFGLENFWCACILLPKGVIRLINRMCKDLFWNTTDTPHKLIFKSWSSITRPWKEGGFDVREILSWNKALIAKQLWLLHISEGGIWFNWVHKYCLRQNTIWDIHSQDSHSQSLRSVLQHALGLCTVAGAFSLTRAYELFRTRATQVRGAAGLMGRGIVPSHAIITMMALQRKLPTVDAITRRGVIFVNRCVLCMNWQESHSHLFFKWSFSMEVWKSLINWMSMRGRSCSLQQQLCWISRNRKSRHWKAIWFKCSFATAVYHLWNERNCRIFRGTSRTTSQLALFIKYVVAIKCLSSVSSRNYSLVVDALNGL